MIHDTYLSVEFSSNPRELCISTAQALSQPQLDNYCLHERERERERERARAGAVLCPLPLPPLTNQQVKRLMLHCSHCSGRSGVSQWLLETRQSLCCCREFNLTLLPLWPCGSVAPAKYWHHTGWLGGAAGIYRSDGFPFVLSTCQSYNTANTTMELRCSLSVLLCSLKCIF